MKVYIAGPITGQPNWNRTSFTAAEERLIEAGHDPVNPHKLHNGRTDLSHGEYMRTDLRALLDCDAIHMLPGWGRSKGARVEREVAWICGITSVRIDGKPMKDDPYPYQTGGEE